MQERQLLCTQCPEELALFLERVFISISEMNGNICTPAQIPGKPYALPPQNTLGSGYSGWAIIQKAFSEVIFKILIQILEMLIKLQKPG